MFNTFLVPLEISDHQGLQFMEYEILATLKILYEVVPALDCEIIPPKNIEELNERLKNLKSLSESAPLRVYHSLKNQIILLEECTKFLLEACHNKAISFVIESSGYKIKKLNYLNFFSGFSKSVKNSGSALLQKNL